MVVAGRKDGLKEEKCKTPSTLPHFDLRVDF
jgi:hypothetical protein